MKKTPNLFLRDANGRLTDEVNPLAQWVIDGEGYPTVKYDGTAVRVTADGRLWARYDCKRGKTPPPSFEPCQDPDPVTGHWPGWVLADRPEDKWIREAADNTLGVGEDQRSRRVGWRRWPAPRPAYRTYEACGPHINGNPECLTFHALLQHGQPLFPTHGDKGQTRVIPTKEALRLFLSKWRMEGIVWWRSMTQGCDKVKIRAVDLGLPWGSRGAA